MEGNRRLWTALNSDKILCPVQLVQKSYFLRALANNYFPVVPGIAEIRAELQSGSEPLALFRATSGCETAKEVDAIPGSLDFDSLINEQSLSPLKGPHLGGSDVLSYMYTSGTTGE